MIVGALRELVPGERRVAIVPATAALLAKAGHRVLVERGAGASAGFPDSAYGSAEVLDRGAVLAAAELLAMVRLPCDPRSPEGAIAESAASARVLVGMGEPLSGSPRIAALAATGATTFALELLPRITRAQSMDVLSSQATVAGYKAVVLAASLLDRMFPMLMTAAGTLAATRVLVLGAGVAGLQALATARRLGATTTGYDIRAAAAEQVRSVGARFLDLGLEAGGEGGGGYARAMDESFYMEQRRRLAAACAEHEVVIATAAVPGRPAPRLVSADAVRGMPPGGVVIDLAAERGGNCELTRTRGDGAAGEIVEVEGRRVLGPIDLASTVPHHASLMYARNLAAFLQLLAKAGAPGLVDGAPDPAADEILRDTLLARDGAVASARARERLPAG
ncbi:MAG: NAD(P)(+) transhydrogenase (Re/Si-specific) subunit alpha [Phycisphaerae bacterium]|nr:NAD(P)(+) transhydrogenase (Re/Si-specific) subunit alpha [Phycisphaerae bacterium]